MGDKASPLTLVQLQEQRDMAIARLEIQELKLLESSYMWDGFGGSDMWDALRDRYDNGQFVPIQSVVSDRKGGANWPLWRTLADLSRLRQESRMVTQGNSFGEGLLNNLVNHVIGKGFAYKAQLKKKIDANPQQPGFQEDEQAAELKRQVQDVIDEFCAVNRWNCSTDPSVGDVKTFSSTKERESYRRVKQDGEAFVRLFSASDGRTFVRFIEPEQIDGTPPGALGRDGWTFGIQHSVDPFEDVEDIEAYWVRYHSPEIDEKEGEEVPASEVVHIKSLNANANAKRGTPAFTFEVSQALQRASKLQRNLSIASAVRAATAEIWEHETGTQAQVSALASGLKDRERTSPATGRTEIIERVIPGGIRRVGKGQKMAPLPASAAVNEHLAAVQGDLMQSLAAFCAPQYFAGDASNANFSSTKEAGTPFVVASEAEQEHFKVAFLCIIWKAIRHAADSGRFGNATFEMVAQEIEIQVEAQSLSQRDPLQKAQQDDILMRNKVKSPQTVAMEAGLDPAHEQANWDEFDARNGQQGGALPMPGWPDDDGGMGGPGMETAPNEPPPDPEQPDDGTDDFGDEDGARSQAEGEIVASLFGDQSELHLDSIEGKRSSLSESLEVVEALQKGYTGYAPPDKLGRKYYYVNGKRTKAPSGGDAAANSQSSAPSAPVPQPKKVPTAKATKKTAGAKENAHAKVAEIIKGSRTPEALQELLGHMAGMTVKELTELKKAHGLKASGTKAILAKKLAERLHGAMQEAGGATNQPAQAPKVEEKPVEAAKPEQKPAESTNPQEKPPEQKPAATKPKLPGMLARLAKEKEGQAEQKQPQKLQVSDVHSAIRAVDYRNDGLSRLDGVRQYLQSQGHDLTPAKFKNLLFKMQDEGDIELFNQNEVRMLTDSEKKWIPSKPDGKGGTIWYASASAVTTEEKTRRENKRKEMWANLKKQQEEYDRNKKLIESIIEKTEAGLTLLESVGPHYTGIMTTVDGRRVRYVDGKPVKLHDTPEGTEHHDDKHFDTSDRPGYTRGHDPKDHRIAMVQVEKKRDVHDVEAKNGMVFRFPDGGTGRADALGAVEKYHASLAEQFDDHLSDTFKEVEWGHKTADEARKHIDEVVDEMNNHLDQSAKEAARFVHTIHGEEGEHGSKKATDIQKRVQDAFDHEEEGLKALAAKAFEVFDQMNADEATHEHDLSDYESELDGIRSEMKDSPRRLRDSLDEIISDLDSERDDAHDAKQSSHHDAGNDLADALNEDDDEEKAQAFNKKADAEGLEGRVDYDEDSGEWSYDDGADEDSDLHERATPGKGVKESLEADIIADLFGESATGFIDLIESWNAGNDGILELTEALQKGFSGFAPPDKLGRRYYYENGKRRKAPDGVRSDSHKAANDHIKAINAGENTPERLQGLLGHLANLSGGELKDLKKAHGLKASATKTEKKKSKSSKAILAERIAERVTNPKEIKIKQPKPLTVRKLVRDYGGFNVETMRGQYDIKTNFIENGMLGLFNKKTKHGIDVVAQQMQDNGVLFPPPGVDATQHLYNLLQKDALAEVADLDKTIEAEAAKYYEEQENARREGHEAPDVEEAERVGKEAALAEIASGEGPERFGYSDGDRGEDGREGEAGGEVGGFDPGEWEEKPAAVKVEDDESEPESQPINYANAITIAADNVKELRKQDVYRVLDSMQTSDNVSGMAAWIEGRRPDLKKEIAEAAADISDERGYAKQAAPAASPAKKEPWEMTQGDYVAEADKVKHPGSPPRKPFMGRNPDGSAKPMPPDVEKEYKTNVNAHRKQINLYKEQVKELNQRYHGHKDAVQSALASGKPVPPEVMADYPDLAAKYGGKAEKPGFTGTDANGHEWVDGKQVAKGEPAEEANPLGVSMFDTSREIKPATPTAPGVSINDIPYNVAHDAHRNTSFVPERRAKQRQNEYVEQMNADWDHLSAMAKTPEDHERLKEEFERYRQGYVKHKLAILHAASRTASPMITGPARFPNESNRKRIDTEHKRIEEFLDYRKKAMGAIQKKLAPEQGPIQSNDPKATEALQAQLQAAETRQERMRKVNDAHKKFLKDPASLDKSDLSESEKEKVRTYKPAYSWEPHPHAPYELTNNNANIKRIKGRIEQIQQMKSGGHQEQEYTGNIRVVEDPDAARIRIHFPGKPAPEVISKLKSSGFRWSPSEGAWQRHLNNGGRYAVDSVLSGMGHSKVEKAEAEPELPPMLTMPTVEDDLLDKEKIKSITESLELEEDSPEGGDAVEPVEID